MSQERKATGMRVFALLLGGAVLAADLATKWLIQHTPQLHHYTVVEGFFRLHYVRNRGIAFGLLHSLESEWKPMLLALTAVAALLVVAYYLISTPAHKRSLFWALGLMLGGILGNFWDRIRHGSVVDFLELHWGDVFSWPTFNIADAAITCGVLLILWDTLRSEVQEAGREKADTAS